ncbi:oxidoreductase [Spirabiliibacterium falconis]|uniref:oxidoreductase n=1 Tax=Spirabiliibacterium falconis TaxID=572023 RepID=UPI001AAD7238|nr:oxidoreductase [Spirabiliibacterium falconis]MBE2893743.1 oxidoreductase [Spirabiliibacterium falconis]
MPEMMNVVIAAEFALAEKVIEALEHSDLPVENVVAADIIPFGDEQGVRFNNRAVAQKAMDDIAWSEVRYFFFAGNIEHAQAVHQAAQNGCVVVDLLGIFASLHDVPLVVPSVNEAQLEQLRNHNIVSLPDPQISQLILAIAPLLESAVSNVVVSSLLPASYVNEEQVRRLAGQTAKLLNGIGLDEDEPRLAFNVAPFTASHFSQARLLQQFRKVLPAEVELTLHPIQSAVFYGLAQHVSVWGEYQMPLDNLLLQWQQNDLVTVYEKEVLTPVKAGELEPTLHISAIEEQENGVTFFSVADDQTFSIATLGIKLAQLCHDYGY